MKLLDQPLKVSLKGSFPTGEQSVEKQQFNHGDRDHWDPQQQHLHQGRDPLARQDEGRKYVVPRRQVMQTQMWKWIRLQVALLLKGSFLIGVRLLRKNQLA